MKNVLGPIIKQVRKEKNMTQSQLSKLTGFNQNTISNHENQNRSLGEKEIAIYAKALNVSPQQLFDYVTPSISTKKDQLNNLFNKLDETGKDNVLKFTKDQLNKQLKENIISLNTNEISDEQIFTIAAHSNDPRKKVSKEEFDYINSVLDEADRSFDKKNNK